MSQLLALHTAIVWSDCTTFKLHRGFPLHLQLGSMKQFRSTWLRHLIAESSAGVCVRSTSRERDDREGPASNVYSLCEETWSIVTVSLRTRR